MHHFATLTACASMLLASCSKDIDAPSLSAAESAAIAEGTAIDADVIFGVWEGESQQTGSSLANTFSQRYRLDFQSIDDAEVLYSHWYYDARTNDLDSVENVAYSYKYSGTGADMTPTNKGLSTMKAVHTGNNKMELYSVKGGTVAHVCTLERISDPEPVVTGVDRTMPQAGEKITITGRNLQFVDHVFLPLAGGGEKEITDFTLSSKQIQFTLPDGDYAQGSVRCQSTGAHVSTYSPAYMFCDDCVFFHTFSYAGGTKPYWKGTEFENTIGINRDAKELIKNATAYSSTAIPSGHSLYGATVKNPDCFLTFFEGASPKAWTVNASSDVSGDEENYLRFSTADCFQRVLDNCGGLLTEDTPCKDVAIQMDVYVYSDGKPEWKTGYVSWRLNKSRTMDNSMVGNVAMWSKENPVSFSDGWKTFTIPLSAFTVINENGWETLGGFISNLKQQSETLIKIMNYSLDAYPAQALESFQFNIANIRLVPYKLPSNKKEE